MAVKGGLVGCRVDYSNCLKDIRLLSLKYLAFELDFSQGCAKPDSLGNMDEAFFQSPESRILRYVVRV